MQHGSSLGKVAGYFKFGRGSLCWGIKFRSKIGEEGGNRSSYLRYQRCTLTDSEGEMGKEREDGFLSLHARKRKCTRIEVTGYRALDIPRKRGAPMTHGPAKQGVKFQTDGPSPNLPPVSDTGPSGSGARPPGAHKTIAMRHSKKKHALMARTHHRSEALWITTVRERKRRGSVSRWLLHVPVLTKANFHEDRNERRDTVQKRLPGLGICPCTHESESVQGQKSV